MEEQRKSIWVKLSSWNRLRRNFKGRKNETYISYIDRLSKEVRK